MGIYALEIDEDVPESAARATNRWLIKNLNDATTAVAPKRRRRSKRNTCKKRCGPASKKSSTVVLRSCVSRESPSAACRLARTERHTAKTPIDRFSGVCRRCRSFGARTGTPGDGHGRGRYREGFCRTFTRSRCSRSSRVSRGLQKVFPVAQGPGFVQLSVQLQRDCNQKYGGKRA